MCARRFPPQSSRRGGYDPPHVSLSHPPRKQIPFARKGFFSCVRFPGDSAGRSGTGPYGKGGKSERRAAHSRPYAATLVKCSHNRPLIGCTPQERPHPSPLLYGPHRFGAPFPVGAHSVRPRICVCMGMYPPGSRPFPLFVRPRRFGAPFSVGAHSVRPPVPAAVTPQGRI